MTDGGPGASADHVARLLDRLVTAAESALRNGDWQVASEAAADVLAIDPDHIGAARIRNRVAAERPRPEGQRVLVTFLFSDLVDSTPMAEGVRLEELRDVMRRYRGVVEAAVATYEGTVLQYQGDGAVACFGYESPHEDDACRAVLAALDLAADVKALAADVREELRADVRVRVGVHTGEVVLADLGGRATDPNRIVGSPANVAARIQAAAAPGTVVMSDLTHGLVLHAVEARSLGVHELKGVSRPVELFEVVRPRHAAERFRASRERAPSLVGRRTELSALYAAWTAVQGGNIDRGVVTITGEAGIGKTRLVAAFAEHVAASGGSIIETACAAYHASVAFWPVARAIEDSLGLALGTDKEADLAPLAEHLGGLGIDPDESLPVLVPVLGLPAPSDLAVPALDPLALRARTLDLLDEWLTRLAARQPRLFVIEDAQWADPTTLELVARFASVPVPGLLFAVTSREPVAVAKTGGVVSIALGPLGRDEAAALLDELDRGGTFDDNGRDALLDRAGGLPLFLEELARSGLTGTESMPLRLHELLSARVRSAPVDLRITQLAAALGVEFTGADLAALEPATDLAEALHALERSGIVRPAPTAGSWAFRHALLREAAYGTQVRETRHANHARIADHLVARLHAPLDPALVATHLDLAGRPLEAVGQYLAAAQAAQSTGAHAEAQRMLGRVLELTEQLGDHPNRSLLEVMAYGLRVLSTASVEGYGSPRAAADLDRVERLAKKLGARPEVLPSLVAVWSARFTLGHLASSRALLEHMEELVADPALAWFAPEVEACAGYQLLYEGRLELAAAELRRSAEGFGARPLEQVLSPFWPLPNDPCAVAHAALMTIAVLDGDLDTKERHRELALARADAVAFPRGAFSRCFVDVYDAWTHLVTDEPAMARDRGASAADLAGRHGLSYFLVLGGIYRYAAPIGWTEADSVDPDGARSVVATTELLGHRSFRPAFLANLAMVLWRAGDENGARRTVADALRAAEQQGEALNVPYVHRVAAHIDAVKDPVAAVRTLVAGIAAAERHRNRLAVVQLWADVAALPIEVRPGDWRARLAAAIAALPPVCSYRDVVTARALLDG